MSCPIRRVWCMPDAETFRMAPVAELFTRHVDVGGGNWGDPFARRQHGWATHTNDINPDADTMWHEDAVTFLGQFPAGYFTGILFDPPYSPRQIKECYDAIGISIAQATTQATFWSRVKDEVARVLKTGGTCISFGWNMQGMGKGRGFTPIEGLVIDHGGMHNATLVTVERKVIA